MGTERIKQGMVGGTNGRAASAAGGVVLAGRGSGSNGSVITMAGSPFTLLNVSGSGSYTRGTAVSITDSYVPVGTSRFNVSDASGLKVGDTVLISRPVTAPWI